ncbi:MAG: ATP-binding cassette domain-containing protein [Hyphomicrobiales bacterium]|nr:ATP-binding cassette domain-containing protein [Hyphomicrobiales bacterium]
MSFPFLYASLELPKIIINKAIGSDQSIRKLFNYEITQIEFLLILCLLFLALVAINGVFKYVINVLKGQLGERMLRRLRFMLFSRVLRFPSTRFRRVSQGEIVAMITAEVEPLGGFIGDAIALPVFQGGTLLTILVFMFVQDFVLGLAAISLYPLQMYVIPKLQKQVNALAKERVRSVRQLSERISEAVYGIDEIHIHDASEWHRSDFSNFGDRIYEIRYKIYKKKFFIKFLNNFLAQITPFFFFSIGGYLVITGSLTFGALVAVLSAYKDLSSPWKELLQWYQQKEDTRVKYEQLIEQFEAPDLLPEHWHRLVAVSPRPLQGRVLMSNVSVEEEGGVKLLDSATIQFALSDKVAFVGPVGSGADIAARILARLIIPTAGTIRMGPDNLGDLPEGVTGRRMAYVGTAVTIGQGTISDALYYGLRHSVVREPRYEGKQALQRQRFIEEAQSTGNSISDLGADWIDHAAIGIDGPAALFERTIEVLRSVNLEDEIFSFGLNKTIGPAQPAALTDAILEAREALRERLRHPDYHGLVESFERTRFNHNMSVAENLLFGRPIGPVFDLKHIGDNAYMLSILDQVELTETFKQTGLQVARIMVDLFEGLQPGHEFFERFSFIDSATLPELQAVVQRLRFGDVKTADPKDVSLLMSLPFQLVPARHRLGLLNERIEQQLLKARHAFAENLPEMYRDAIAFFDRSSFVRSATIQDNILFGKLAYGRLKAQETVGDLMRTVIDELGLRQLILKIGLDFEVGVGGRRLSTGQRQKLGLARALLKKPDIMIIDQATAALDQNSKEIVHRTLLSDNQHFGVVWVVGEEFDLEHFDKFVRFDAGRVIEQAPVPETASRTAAQYKHTNAESGMAPTENSRE